MQRQIRRATSFVTLGAVLLIFNAGAAGPDPRATTADGQAFPPAGPCTLTASLPVLRRALGALPELAGPRKVWPIDSSSPVVARWRARLAANHVPLDGYSYIGPGIDYEAECVLLGVESGRVNRILLLFPGLTLAKANSVTARLATAGVAVSNSGGGFSITVQGLRVAGQLVGSHPYSVADYHQVTVHDQVFNGAQSVTHHTETFASAIEFAVHPTDWYLATRQVQPNVAAAMRDGQLIAGMTLDEADATLGQPESRTTDSAGCTVCCWSACRAGAGGARSDVHVFATFRDGVVIQYRETQR